MMVHVSSTDRWAHNLLSSVSIQSRQRLVKDGLQWHITSQISTVGSRSTDWALYCTWYFHLLSTDCPRASYKTEPGRYSRGVTRSELGGPDAFVRFGAHVCDHTKTGPHVTETRRTCRPYGLRLLHVWSLRIHHRHMWST